jgi:hypothetical protein
MLSRYIQLVEVNTEATQPFREMKFTPRVLFPQVMSPPIGDAPRFFERMMIKSSVAATAGNLM